MKKLTAVITWDAGDGPVTRSLELETDPTMDTLRANGRYDAAAVYLCYYMLGLGVLSQPYPAETVAYNEDPSDASVIRTLTIDWEIELPLYVGGTCFRVFGIRA